VPLAREVLAPRSEDGNFFYELKEIVTTGEFDSGWMVNSQPKAEFPTSTEPAIGSVTAPDEIDSS
jgi:hypothetical protein